MRAVSFPFGPHTIKLGIPDSVDVLGMGQAPKLANPAREIRDALDNSIESPGLDMIIADKVRRTRDPSAVVVVSDNTRPVPYKGDADILWPVIERLLKGGISVSKITILVATGTHHGLSEDSLKEMISSRVIQTGIRIINHDCTDSTALTYLGKTSRGSDIYVNKLYTRSDIKILTGLVESHFMAGASGGRKSICPGLIGEQSTYVFHGVQMLAHPQATDLVLDGNPCHEEALEVARAAGADYIVNVTLDHDFNPTGVFAGDLNGAHEKAVEHIKKYIVVDFHNEYDAVVTHAGFVGINHYQAAKAGTVAARVVKSGGHVLMLAYNSDTGPLGSSAYKTVLHILKRAGPEALGKLLVSPDWTFIPEQWQAQMWTKLFNKIPIDHFYYYSPQFGPEEYEWVPGRSLLDFADVINNGNRDQMGLEQLVPSLVSQCLEKLKKNYSNPDKMRIAFLKDGPYGIPIAQHRPSSGSGK